MLADAKLSKIYGVCIYYETHTSVDVTHEKLPVRNNFEVRHRVVPRRIYVVENVIAFGARYTSLKALDGTSAGACVDNILRKSLGYQGVCDVLKRTLSWAMANTSLPVFNRLTVGRSASLMRTAWPFVPDIRLGIGER